MEHQNKAPTVQTYIIRKAEEDQEEAREKTAGQVDLDWLR